MPTQRPRLLGRCIAAWVQAAVYTTVLLCLTGTSAVAEQRTELIMFEQDACEWCEAWHSEIGPAYPNTWEGKTAPLRQVDIHENKPADLEKVRWPRFTPVFVLMVEGVEKGRLRGYPGEDFFWPLLSEMLQDAGINEPTNN